MGIYCLGDSDQINASHYLNDILKTIDTETTRIELIEMQFAIVLEPTLTDEDGLIHLNFNDLPLIFSPGSWSDIGRVFSALSHKGGTQFRMIILCDGPDPSRQYKHIISPASEAKTLCGVIFQWMKDSIVPDGVFSSEARFEIVVYPYSVDVPQK